MIVHSKHSAPSEEPASAGALVRMALIGAGMVLFAAVLPSLLLTAAPAGVATLPLAKSAAAIIAAAALPAAVGIAVIAVLTRHICRRWGRLAESRARNRAIVDNMIDGAIHIDHNGNLVALNAAAEGIFGRTSQEVRGRPLTTLLAGPDRNDIAARIRDGSGGDLGETREATGLRRDGSTFPLYLAISTVNVGAHPVYTAIVRDLTETRDRMQELAKARDDALAPVLQMTHDCGEWMVRSEEIRVHRQTGHTDHSRLEGIETVIQSPQPFLLIEVAVVRDLSEGV